ncbi:MAG: hypothetical protein MI924_23150 [Chloroflexales bacterium]|nr:hypothetical protein [Chloroflexales bacterium]
MTVNQPEPKVANITLRMLLNTITRLMGRRGLRLILSRADRIYYLADMPPENFQLAVPCSTLTRIFNAIEAVGGKRAMRMFMAHAGKDYTEYLWQAIPHVFESMRDTIDRTLTPHGQLRYAVDLLAAAGGQFAEVKVVVEEIDNAIYFTLPYTLDSWGQNAETPICWSMRTSLETQLKRLTNDNIITVREMTCRACGNANCSFQISREESLPLYAERDPLISRSVGGG